MEGVLRSPAAPGAGALWPGRGGAIALLRGAMIWGAVATQVRLTSPCDFDHPIDPDKQMMGLTQDYNAYSLDVCKENCCSDSGCTAYQFQQGFHGQMSCMRGPESKDLMVRRPATHPTSAFSRRSIA